MSVLQKITKGDSQDIGPSTTAHGDGGDGGGGGGDDDAGGLSWLTKAVENPLPSTTMGTVTVSTAEVDLDSGNDWLAAASSSQTKRNSPATESTIRATTAPAAPGGWMSSGKLGISTEDSSDQESVGTAGAGGSATSTAVAAKTRKRKQARLSVSAASGPGGWLSAGALGVPTEDGHDDDDEEQEIGDGNGKAVGVTIDTQTEDDIEAVTQRGGAEKNSGRKLPPWAKPWVPPPKPQVVPDPSPEVTSAPSGETKKKVL